jgi:L-histidine N-alpha-methyltransferase
MNKQFAQDVQEGLSASPKRLPSKYFYDKEGDRIFQAIMEMPEYYLTRSEFDVLQTNKEKLLGLFKNSSGRFNLIDLGAGDGFKTKLLLKHFIKKKTNFRFMPIDISANALELLIDDLKDHLPDLQVKPICDDYFRALSEIKQKADRRNVVLFLGSNIGNFPDEEAKSFLKKLSESLNTGDLVLVGFDLKKDPEVIRNAYNDPAGITRAFNMNLLKRINRELDGNFDLDKFQHYQMYNPESGEARSFLVSREKQQVYIKALDQEVEFQAWEPIHVEISRKYDLDTIKEYAAYAGFSADHFFYDHRNYYVNTLWMKK